MERVEVLAWVPEHIGFEKASIHEYVRSSAEADDPMQICRGNDYGYYADYDPSTDGTDEPEVILGTDKPGDIRYFAEHWCDLDAQYIAKWIRELVDEAEKSEETLEATLSKKSSGAMYDVMCSIRQVAGYPDYGMQQVFLDRNGSFSARPDPSEVKDVQEHPEQYANVLIYYHS